MGKRNKTAGDPPAPPDPDDLVPPAGKHAARPSEAERLEALGESPEGYASAPADAVPGTDEPVPGAGDPGGAHAKGFSADPRPEVPVDEDGPVPLADAPDTQPAVHQPERDAGVQGTGRSKPGDYAPNDRLMGSDR
jgi:hypothetical protein